jgi:hypothetical protein
MDMDELMKSLGRIEGKQNEMCNTLSRVHDRQKSLDDKLTQLPCERHVKEYNMLARKTVPWRIFLTIICIITSLIFGAYSYTYVVERSVNDVEAAIGEYNGKR